MPCKSSAKFTQCTCCALQINDIYRYQENFGARLVLEGPYVPSFPDLGVRLLLVCFIGCDLIALSDFAPTFTAARWSAFSDLLQQQMLPLLISAWRTIAPEAVCIVQLCGFFSAFFHAGRCPVSILTR